MGIEKEVIKVGIFFDGTGNNGCNVEEHLINPKEAKAKFASYWMSKTNIYRLYQMYDGEYKIYIGGIGTLNGKADDMVTKMRGDYDTSSVTLPGMGRGKKEYGALAKHLEAKSELDLIIKKNSQSALELNIFGFSRGAALARNFSNYIKKINKKNTEEIHVNFLGLFDTVESFRSNNIEEYNCSVSEVANVVFQLSALHECRENFPLSTILSEQQWKARKDMVYNEFNVIESDNNPKGKEYKYIELVVPGCHADIGGGYKDITSDKIFLDSSCKFNFLSKHKLWKIILDGKISKKFRFDIPMRQIKLTRGKKVKLISGDKDFISGRLQWVNLLLMTYKAKSYGCNFNIDKVQEYESYIDNFEIKNEIPSIEGLHSNVINCKLNNLKNYKNYILKEENQKIPVSDDLLLDISNFIHVSVNYSNFISLITHSQVDEKSQPIQTVLTPDFSGVAMILNETLMGGHEKLIEGEKSYGLKTTFRPLRATKNWSRNILIPENQ